MIKKKIKVYYQVNTKNESFIEVYRQLKELGIKNNKFFLKLYDKSLANVDPFDENLDILTQSKIQAECKKNYWYFIRECVRIPVPGGLKPYSLHRGNVSLSWCLLNNFNVIQILPRQHGKTICAVVFYLWLYLFATSNSAMAFLNKKYDDSKLNLRRFKEIRECLPSYLQMMDPMHEIYNLTRVESDINGNTVTACPTANDESSADNLGRGRTEPCQWYDEFAFLKYNKIVYASATPANSQASLEAEANGKPHHRLITTTPGDMNTLHGYFTKIELLDNAAVFVEEMYDWNKVKCEDYISKNSKNNFLFIQFSYRELGRDEKWFENQCRELNNDWFKIKREILLEWNKSSDLSPFSEEQIETLEQFIKNPVAKLFIKEVYPFTCYEDFDFREKVIISVDPSGGLSKDNSSITIASASNLHVLADFENNTVDVPELANIIIELSKYFPNGPIVIERNNYGLTLLQILLRNKDIERRLYYEYKTTKAEKRVVDVKTKSSTTKTKTKVYGINTSEISRGQMMDILFDYMNNPYEGINSRRIIRDISGLERKKRGKIEHSDNSHDDSLMSWLFIHWVWNFGTNLSKFTIKKKDIRSISDNDNIIHLDDEDNEIKIKYINIAKLNNDDYVRNNIKNNTGKNHYVNSDSIIEQYYDEMKLSRDIENPSRNSSSMLSFINSLNK